MHSPRVSFCQVFRWWPLCFHFFSLALTLANLEEITKEKISFGYLVCFTGFPFGSFWHIIRVPLCRNCYEHTSQLPESMLNYLHPISNLLLPPCAFFNIPRLLLFLPLIAPYHPLIPFLSPFLPSLLISSSFLPFTHSLHSSLLPLPLSLSFCNSVNLQSPPPHSTPPSSDILPPLPSVPFSIFSPPVLASAPTWPTSWENTHDSTLCQLCHPVTPQEQRTVFAQSFTGEYCLTSVHSERKYSLLPAGSFQRSFYGDPDLQLHVFPKELEFSFATTGQWTVQKFAIYYDK